MEYICLYYSYLKKTERLTDTQMGRLIRAVLSYAATGERKELDQAESMAFDFIAADIESAKEKYIARCETNRRNRTGTTDNDRQQSSTVVDETGQTKTETKTETKTKTETNTLNPPTPLLELPEELQRAAAEWVAYKKEINDPYKTTGLKALVAKLKKDAAENGEAAVIDAIRYSMAQGWHSIHPEKNSSNSTEQKAPETPASYNIDRADQKAKTSVPKLVKKQQPGTEKSSSMI